MICIDCGGEIEEGNRKDRPPTESKFCLRCRANRRRQAILKYRWLPQHDAYMRAHYHGGLHRRGQVITDLIRQTGFPRGYIKRQAQRLGLTLHPERRDWTLEQLETLEKLLGRVSAATIARRLYRTETSVVMKIKSFGNSRRVTEGYTIRDLEECLGEDHHKIHKWVSNGWLKERSQQTNLLSGSGREIHHFQEKDVISFIKHHGTEINLGKVDQVWFLDMILLKGKMANGPVRSRKEDTGKRVLTEHGIGSRLMADSQNIGRNTL